MEKVSKYGELKALGKCTSCQNDNDTPEFSKCSRCRERNRKWDRETRQWYGEHGICNRCHKYDVAPGKKMCYECLAYYCNWQNTKRKLTDEQKQQHNDYLRKRYQIRKENGLCVKCGKSRGYSRSNTMCNECYQKHRRMKSKAYWDKIDIPRKARPDHGLCFICGKPYESNEYKLCDDCREVSRQAALAEDKTNWLEWQRQENCRVRGYRYQKERYNKE